MSLPLGNIPHELKLLIISQFTTSINCSPALSRTIGGTIRIKELWINRSHRRRGADDQGLVICEMPMCDEMRSRDGGLDLTMLSAIVDLCSALSLQALALSNGGMGDGVSHNMTLTFHEVPTPKGTLRITSSTVSMSQNEMTSRCEVWEKETGGLIATAVHTKIPTATVAKL
ncbi:hypothetical protein SISNIDRAFT_451231 [Sistotremastrum niveocremeum HHB9708]|uniref:Thioesterase domain-containing protein n=1 Tax=Sistotremastrum niveocremeum HHB9708 TaxID=1314777 RepID=A0A164Y0T4_9AGAM|nr:hypothetical protein SISNIDRAFT_451231 [Sistotremastrum niveocremeum HHB9708]